MLQFSSGVYIVQIFVLIFDFKHHFFLHRTSSSESGPRRVSSARLRVLLSRKSGGKRTAAVPRSPRPVNAASTRTRATTWWRSSTWPKTTSARTPASPRTPPASPWPISRSPWASPAPRSPSPRTPSRRTAPSARRACSSARRPRRPGGRGCSGWKTAKCCCPRRAISSCPRASCWWSRVWPSRTRDCISVRARPRGTWGRCTRCVWPNGRGPGGILTTIRRGSGYWSSRWSAVSWWRHWCGWRVFTTRGGRSSPAAPPPEQVCIKRPFFMNIL